MTNTGLTTASRKLAIRSAQLDALWAKVIAARIAYEADPSEATASALDIARTNHSEAR